MVARENIGDNITGHNDEADYNGNHEQIKTNRTVSESLQIDILT